MLVSLAVGYWFGGRFADRHPHKQGLCALVLVAALAVCADPLRRGSVPRRLGRRARRGVGGRVHRLAGRRVGARRAAGDAARRGIAVRDPARRRARRGERHRRGPDVRDLDDRQPRRDVERRRCCWCRCSARGARSWSSGSPARGRGHRVAPPRGARGAGGDRRAAGASGRARSRLPATARCSRRSRPTYQYARVVEEPDGERELELNEGQAVHSLYRPGSYLTGDYWDEFLVLPFAARLVAAAVGGDPRQRGRHDCARARALLPRHVGRCGRDRLRADPAGARAGSTCATPACACTTRTRGRTCAGPTSRYDAIMVDVYRQPYIPFYLATREFFELARDHLHPGWRGDRERRPSRGPGRARKGAVGATMGDVFGTVAARSERGHQHAC